MRFHRMFFGNFFSLSVENNTTDRLAHDVVFGNETPKARVGRVVPVVPHHEIVIHAERICIGRFAVDVDHAVFDLQAVAFVNFDDAAIKRQVFFGQLYGSPFRRDPQRSEVIRIPGISAGTLRKNVRIDPLGPRI